jgi:RNA polymerase sigma factor (sigma-70 family)
MNFMKAYRSNEQLIDTFLTGERVDSGTAFETLVKRHGPMVLAVCRNVLRRDQDAEDAFQATFLVLARKAGTIHNREFLGCWLHEVAYRVAIRARERRARSALLVENQEVEETRSGPEHVAIRKEIRLLLRAEVEGLPAKYRLPVLHTYLGGKTNEQVARLLQCPVGTVKGRLSRARDLLRARLSGRGWDHDGGRFEWSNKGD